MQAACQTLHLVFMLHLCAGTFYALGALEDKARAKVFGAYIFIGGKFLRSAGLKDNTLIQKIRAVCDCKGFTHIVVCDNNADIAVFQLCDDVLDILHGNGVNPGKGLIQEYEFGIYGKGAGYLAAAALTTGKLDAAGLTYLGEVEFIYEPFHALYPLGLCHSLCGTGDLHYGHDIVLYGHLAEHGCFLGKVADTALGPLVHGEGGDVRDVTFVVLEVDISAVRLHLAGDHIETGGLTGTVRAQESHYLSLLHLHGYALHNGTDTVFLDNLICNKFHNPLLCIKAQFCNEITYGGILLHKVLGLFFWHIGHFLCVLRLRGYGNHNVHLAA